MKTFILSSLPRARPKRGVRSLVALGCIIFTPLASAVASAATNVEHRIGVPISQRTGVPMPQRIGAPIPQRPGPTMVVPPPFLNPALRRPLGMAKLPVPHDFGCDIDVKVKFIYAEWMRIGGPYSAIGCPREKFVQDNPSGSGYQQFDSGQIAVSPNVWEHGVVAAYQDGNDIIVDWNVSMGDPPENSHFHYDEFLARWDFNGSHTDNGSPCKDDPTRLPGDGDQCDVIADMTDPGVQIVLLHYYNDTHMKTRGTFHLPVKHGDGTYHVSIKGCDTRTIGSAKCKQDWMHAVDVKYKDAKGAALDALSFPNDLRGITSATDVKSSHDAAFARAAAFVRLQACQMLPYSDYRNEEGYGTIALAKLAYADYFAKDHCPGRTVENRAEVLDSLAQQEVGSKTGTSRESCPFCRTGEYDVALTALVAMAYSGNLPPPLYTHVLNLLDERGPLDTGEFSVGGGPETENHINNIESSRYLTNDLLFAATGINILDNGRNGMKEWWLKRLQNFMMTDFIEL